LQTAIGHFDYLAKWYDKVELRNDQLSKASENAYMLHRVGKDEREVRRQ